MPRGLMFALSSQDAIPETEMETTTSMINETDMDTICSEKIFCKCDDTSTEHQKISKPDGLVIDTACAASLLNGQGFNANTMLNEVIEHGKLLENDLPDYICTSLENDCETQSTEDSYSSDFYIKEQFILLRKQIAKLTTRKKELKMKISELENKVSCLKQNQSTYKCITQEDTISLQNYRALVSQNEQLRHKLCKAKERRKSAEDCSSLTTENRRLRCRLQEAEVDRNAILEELNLFKISAKESLLHQHCVHQEELKEWEGKYAALVTEYEQVRNKLFKANETAYLFRISATQSLFHQQILLQNKLNEWQTKYTLLVTENETLGCRLFKAEEDLIGLQTTLNSFRNSVTMSLFHQQSIHHQELTELESRYSVIVNENEQIRNQLFKAEEDRKLTDEKLYLLRKSATQNLSNQQSLLQNKLDDLKSKYASAVSENEQLQVRFYNLETERNSIQEEFDLFRKSAAESSSHQQSVLNNNFKEFQKKYALMITENEQLRSRIGNTEGDRSSIREEFDFVRHPSTGSLSKQQSFHQDKLKEIQREYTVLVATNEQLRCSLNKVEGDRNSIQQELSSFQNSTSTHLANQESLVQNKMQGFQRSFETSKINIESLRESHTELEAANQRLQSEALNQMKRAKQHFHTLQQNSSKENVDLKLNLKAHIQHSDKRNNEFEKYEPLSIIREDELILKDVKGQDSTKQETVLSQPRSEVFTFNTSEQHETKQHNQCKKVIQMESIKPHFMNAEQRKLHFNVSMQIHDIQKEKLEQMQVIGLLNESYWNNAKQTAENTMLEPMISVIELDDFQPRITGLCQIKKYVRRETFWENECCVFEPRLMNDEKIKFSSEGLESSEVVNCAAYGESFLILPQTKKRHQKKREFTCRSFGSPSFNYSQRY